MHAAVERRSGKPLHAAACNLQGEQASACGLCTQETIIKLQEEQAAGSLAGLDIESGEAMDPSLAGVYDNYIVKRQILQSAPIIATQLLLVDEVLRAGANMRRGGPGG